MRQLVDKMGGRKWVLTLLGLAVGVALAVASAWTTRPLLTTELVALIIGLVGVYAGANAATHRGYASAGKVGADDIERVGDGDTA